MDAICLVAQAFLPILLNSHPEIAFDSMLSMLGKHMKDNIQLLITFADVGTPPVLEALKKADLLHAQDEPESSALQIQPFSPLCSQENAQP
ncbi:hypothetical protein E2320_022761 [Naja naja]|nr:hypothetical protein E2320_022761 [Naja naja]